MKKITFSIFSLLTLGLNAQITLTQASHNFVVGDSYSLVKYDTTGSAPRNTGANQTWDFSAIATINATPNESVLINDATTMPAVPANSTVAEIFPSVSTNFYKTTAGTTYLTGVYQDGVLNANFSSDPLPIRNWDLSFGEGNNYSSTGTFTSSNPNLPSNGNIDGEFNYGVAGYGTLTAPDGTVYSNVLQIIDTTNVSIAWVPQVGIDAGLGISTVSYKYYIAGQKQPVVTYEDIMQTAYAFNNMTVQMIYWEQTPSYKLAYSEASPAGITSIYPADQISVYPNPATSEVYISSVNELTATIVDLNGSVISSTTISGIQALSIENLQNGTYILQLADAKGNVQTRKITKL